MDSKSTNNVETLIWPNINDSRNEYVIVAETKKIRDFVPKTQNIKEPDNTNEAVPESAVKDIIDTDYTKQNIYELIVNQATISSYLVAMFRTSSDSTEWSVYRQYLSWILETSEYICTTFNVPPVQTKNNKASRSSYEFCKLKERCRDTFGNPFGHKDEYSCCSGDHFVHNKLVNDLHVLIEAGDSNEESNSDDTNMLNILRIGLNTTEYVIKKMHETIDAFWVHFNGSSGFSISSIYVVSTHSQRKGQGRPQRKTEHNNDRHNYNDRSRYSDRPNYNDRPRYGDKPRYNDKSQRYSKKPDQNRSNRGQSYNQFNSLKTERIKPSFSVLMSENSSDDES